MTSSIELTAGGLSLDGAPTVVLCSSVFPFRIPRQQWDHRLQLVAESGYGMIDLYVHWGFHEETPGAIDLTTPERDLRHFLHLAHTHGLLVMARPGPYICSETDGGGLPWWLHGGAADAPAALRTSDPDYLAAVDRWFAAVMPILADAQITRGGPVALVQIENELDFFDCPDPDDYMAHLAESAREHGIEVPIIGCAGQGDLHGASGDADGVVPTVNLYPDDASVTFDEEARHYAGILSDRQLPLMVTETNRMHRTLRREILAGARLVAPYLQTSGFDHLVLPSAGNWGDPGNLMTHDYDFGGYISPEGRRRPEYDEAIALAATLDAWGERLASATPVPLAQLPIEGAAAGGALALPGGGHIVGPAELQGLEALLTVHPTSEGSPAVLAPLAPGACPFWALDVPLEPWGSEGTLVVATAELVEVQRHTGPAGPVGPDGAVRGGAPLMLTFEGTATSRIELVLPSADGSSERVLLEGPGRARSLAANPAVEVLLREREESRADPEPIFRRSGGSVLPLGETLRTAGRSPSQPPSQSGSEPEQVPENVLNAEALGLADGRLQAELELSAEATEVLLLGAADLVRLELDGVDHGVHVTHGAPLSLPLAPGTPHRLRVVAETWGRANFDDARRPALHLGAGRGAGTVLEVIGGQDVTDLWEVRRLPDRRERGGLAVPPIRGIGGWSSANPGVDTTYARTLPLPGPGRLAVLRLRGLTHPVHVAIDGDEQLVMPAAPVVVLEGEGSTVEISVRAPHVPGGLLESAELLQAAVPLVREVTLLREAELAKLLSETAQAALAEQWQMLPVHHGKAAEAGLRIGAGTPVLVRLEAELESGGLLLDLEGVDVQVTVIAGGRRVSRHVLGAPATAGGNPGRSWIPASWCEGASAEVLLLVEALSRAGGIFEEVRSSPTMR
ncbi:MULTISPECIES: beta-galactosidase [unclassified Brachybacterium]|uniref:beta-galactosidase n=1 Tax=unclassified Brachybacterium TaxID=2623841 RepID=UPI00402AA846